MVDPVLFYCFIVSMTERKSRLLFYTHRHSTLYVLSPCAAKLFGQGKEKCDPQHFQLYYLPKS